jgi:hypothetical protein
MFWLGIMKERSYLLNKFSLIKDEFHSISQKIKKKTLFGNIFVIFLYTILTVLLTYPVAFTIGTNIPGWGDAFSWMNGLWYTNFALLHPEITSFTHTNMIFYPMGIPTLPFSSAFNQIIAIILLPFCQIHIIYSLVWLLSFILAAFGAYLLIRYLTQNEYAAFLSGIIFAFSPYHFAHGMGHLGATTIQWIPFCALFFMKVFREGGIKNCILAGIFYILVAMSDMQYLVIMGIFIAILFVYEHLICFQKNKIFLLEIHKSILIKYLIIGVVAFSVIIPLTLADIQVASSGNNFLKPNPLEAITYSTDLISFFLPSILHPVFGDFVTPTHWSFAGNSSENTTYIGYSVLILSIIALISLWKDRIVRFWGIVALIFSLFSLGPVLHIAGETIFTVFNVSFPLPYILLYYFVPFAENIRTTGRFFIVAALAFSVLAGYGCSVLLKKYDAKKIIIVILIGSLIIFEYLSIPFTISSVDQPEFYQKIGLDPDQYALLEIPISSNYNAGVTIIYYQTLHGKPVVGGQAARVPVNARNFEINTPFINELTFMKPLSNDIIRQNLSELGNSILSYYNIRYVILHTKYLNADQLNTLNSILSPQFDAPNLYKNDSLIVYQVKNETPKSFISLSNGWYSVETLSGTPTRWTGANASLNIYSPEQKNSQFGMQLVSFYRERTLELSLNNIPQHQIKIPTNSISVSVPVTLEKGKNNITLKIIEGCEIPNSISSLNNRDGRCLGVAIQNITLG